MRVRKVVISGIELVVGGGVVGLVIEMWRPRTIRGKLGEGNLERWRPGRNLRRLRGKSIVVV